MTRKKVKLAFIINDSSRKATFKKRKKGLMKKVSELSTLCGIDACAIVYSPYESQPDVWPDGRGAQRVLAQFKRMPEMEQSKKMVNQESFIRNRITKAADQLKKLHKENREKEMTHLMYQCLIGKGLQGLAMPELNDMGWLLDQNLKEIYKRVDGLKKAIAGSGLEERPAVVEIGGGMDGHGMQRAAPALQQQQQWLTEWMGNNTSDQSQQQQMAETFGHGGGGGGGGDEMMMPFNDGNNNAVMWSNVFMTCGKFFLFVHLLLVILSMKLVLVILEHFSNICLNILSFFLHHPLPPSVAHSRSYAFIQILREIRGDLISVIQGKLTNLKF